MKNLIRICAMGLGLVSAWAGDWVMFSDGRDTYIYSTATGEIYIRHAQGGQNYEDVFVKMSRGMQPHEIKNAKALQTSPQIAKNPSQSLPQAPSISSTGIAPIDSNHLKEMQLNALKKSQDLLHSAFE